MLTARGMGGLGNLGESVAIADDSKVGRYVRKWGRMLRGLAEARKEIRNQHRP